MGYDFSFMRLFNPPEDFPFDLSNELDFQPAEFTDLKGIGDLLMKRKEFVPNGRDGEQNFCYWWNTPDGGSICAMLHKYSVGVDTHAHWSFVLEIYDCLIELYPDLVILDIQTGEIYDRESYGEFIQKTWQLTK